LLLLSLSNIAKTHANKYNKKTYKTMDDKTAQPPTDDSKKSGGGSIDEILALEPKTAPEVNEKGVWHCSKC